MLRKWEQAEGLLATWFQQPGERRQAFDRAVGKLRELPRKNPDGSSDMVPMLDQVTSIPAEVLINWAASRAETLPLLDKIDHAPAKDFTARYAGAATFTIPLPRPTRDTTDQITQLEAAQKWTDRPDLPREGHRR